MRTPSRKSWIANARMYAVSPRVEEAWRALLDHITDDAQVPLDYIRYPAPRPLDDLWSRADLGCVFMCGYPIALDMADVVPIAGPIPRATWAGGRSRYRSDLIVRADSGYQSLEDTFGGVAGWTVRHSHSGFNAFRHHLLPYRTPERPTLYRDSVGDLVTARAVVDAVISGRIDVGPLDGYWHSLIARHLPDLTAGIRVIASTAVAPMPAFVASSKAPPAMVAALKSAFAASSGRPWFGPVADELVIDGFEVVSRDDFATTLAWDREAKAAGYDAPA